MPPPFNEGSFHVIVAELLAELFADKEVGIPGIPIGVTDEELLEGGLSPDEFVAVTVKL